MFDINTYDIGVCDEKEYTRVVCVSKYKGKYVFCYNTKRNGWEIPGGHIEEGETWEEAAKREMYEETGAIKVNLTPVCVYKISTYGLLCYCEVLEFGDLPKEFEMNQVMLSDTLPDNLTFPESSKVYFDAVNKRINSK